HPPAPRGAGAERRDGRRRLSRQAAGRRLEAAPESSRKRRAEPAERRDDPRHGLLAQGVPRRRPARAAALQRHAPLPADVDQAARRHRGGSAGAASAEALWDDQVRDVEPGVPLLRRRPGGALDAAPGAAVSRSEEHTSELQSRFDLVCRLLLEKKKNINTEISAKEVIA